MKMLEAALTSSGARDAFYTDSNTRKIKDMIMASKDKCQVSFPACPSSCCHDTGMLRQGCSAAGVRQCC